MILFALLLRVVVCNVIEAEEVCRFSPLGLRLQKLTRVVLCQGLRARNRTEKIAEFGNRFQAKGFGFVATESSAAS